jgi:PAS domain S-box-containing protein
MDISQEIEELKRLLEPNPRSSRSKIDLDLPAFKIDREGNFTSVPPAMERITGFSKEELHLLSFSNVVFIEDRPKVISAINSILDGKKIVILEIEIFSEKTGSHPIELIMLPLLEESEIIGVWGVLKDIEGRKDIEYRLEETKEVQEASRQFLRDFVSLMAREIRQPLTTILLTLEMFDSGFFGDVNDQQREKIDQLISLVDRLKTILIDAISTSNDIGEEIKLERRMVSLKNVISDVLEERKEILDNRSIKVQTSFPERDEKVPGDRKALIQAVSILVDNSINQSPQGSHLMIELEEKNEELQFSIADSGEGIPEDEVETLFDKLHVDQEKETGSFKEGLNLYMTKRMIETHGGRIWCESFPGLGSSFIFTIPLKKEANDETP